MILERIEASQEGSGGHHLIQKKKKKEGAGMGKDRGPSPASQHAGQHSMESAFHHLHHHPQLSLLTAQDPY